MATLRIESLKLDGPWRDQVSETVTLAFGRDFGPKLAREADATLSAMSADIDTTSGSGDLLFGAFDGDRLAGVNAFLRHDCALDGEPMTFFQSCWTATHPGHRGKGVFQSIVAEAHDQLRAVGAKGVFGWPNPNSEPIFVHKLGYHRRPTEKVNARALPFGPHFGRGRPRGLDPNDHQLIERNRRKYDDLIVVEGQFGIAWGRVRRRTSFPRGLPYLAIGGFRWRGDDGASQLARAMAQASPMVAYWQFQAPTGCTSLPMIGAAVPSSAEPFIIFPFERGIEQLHFDMFDGVRDVY